MDWNLETVYTEMVYPLVSMICAALHLTHGRKGIMQHRRSKF